ncbi:MAG: hypothetical protein LBN43_06945 [Oscillospiraceae bacterium]|jgi:hypothetical protein|nr:hypothetical protein [Oscillospiraceae bacterium]
MNTRFIDILIKNWYLIILLIPLYLVAEYLRRIGRAIGGLLSGWRFMEVQDAYTIDAELPKKLPLHRRAMQPPENESDFRYKLYFFGGELLLSIPAVVLLIFLIQNWSESIVIRQLTLRRLGVYL